MLTKLKAVLEAAESLDRPSKYELVETLARELGPSMEQQRLWAEEAQRRNRELENAEGRTSDTSDVIAKVRRSISR